MPRRAKSMKDISVRIKSARVTAGYSTADEFAQEIDENPATYRRYERGEVEPPVKVWLGIKRVTGYSLDWIFTGEGDPRPKKAA